MAPRRPLLYLLLAAATCAEAEAPSGCEEAHRLFQQRQLGPAGSPPARPSAGSKLQVCASTSTCCSRKMEERYQVAARRDIQDLLQAHSSPLKDLISRNVAAFQDTFESALRQSEDYTNSVLFSTYRTMASDVSEVVGELFTDVGLFVLGSELNMDEVAQRFFDALFPMVYEHLINPGLSPLSGAYAECVRSSRRDVAPFGSAPALLSSQVSRAALPARVFLQALHLGVEVINTTDHLLLSRECKRGLLRMSYCSHCQGYPNSRPCMGYCLNVLRGCLAGLAEVDPHWLEFVRSLEDLSAQMHGTQDLEQVLLGVHSLVQDAVAQAQKNAHRLSSQVEGICGVPSRSSSLPGSMQQNTGRESGSPLRARDTDNTFANTRKEFINSLRLYRTFYGGLADKICMNELASGDGHACWNGADVVKSYTLRVVGNGIKAQTINPEVKVKGEDPVINQIIDKLKHINQLLQGKSIPKFGTLDQIETGSGDGEGHYSGDCDDEDGCSGSGNGEVRRPILSNSKWTKETRNERPSHPKMKVFDVYDESRSGGGRLGASLVLVLTCVLTLSSW
ncbi:glypican-5a [Denticeps clupeoides]|uniref:Glypican-5 n=1 Tax=Denticeps clupeoides TaxID=299321 RepID=A0AAY4BCV3_9TELE|nr:glypican-5 [Denticeps clupeoides]